MWAFYSNRVEQFVPAGKKGLLVTERLFVVHYAIRHSEENCGDSPSGGCMWLSSPLCKESKKMLEERSLEVDSDQCLRCPQMKVLLVFKNIQ